MTGAAACLAVLPLVSAPVPDAYQPARTLAVCVAALAACLASVGVRRRHGRAAVVVLTSLLLGWMVVSALVAEPSSSVFGVHGRFQGLVSAFAVALAGLTGVLAGARSLRTGTWVVAATALVQVASMTSQRLGGLPAEGMFGNTVLAGAWLSVAASVLSASFLTRTGFERRLLGVAALLSAAAVGMTGSRGAVIGLICGLAVACIPLFAQKRTRKPLVAASIVTAVVLSLGIVAAGPGFSGKFTPQALTSGSGASRLAIWQGSVAMIQDSPLTGIGPGRFIYEFPRRQPAEYALHEGADTRPDQAHSLALHLTTESGVPAVILALALVALIASAAVRGIRERNGVSLIAAAGFAAYLGQATFGVAAIETDALGWFLAGVTLATAERKAPTETAGGPVRRRRGWAVSGSAALVALIVAATVTQYLRADAAYGRFLEAFRAGAFDAAAANALEAIELAPVQDVYRVAYSDAALYAGGGVIKNADAVLKDGLRLEPDSYELLSAHARLLEKGGAPEREVAAAYLAAVHAWPQGIEIRTEAARACRQAGMTSRADTLEREVASLVEAQQKTGAP